MTSGPLRLIVLCFVLACLAAPVIAQPVAGTAGSPDGLWGPPQSQPVVVERRTDIDGPYAVVQLDRNALEGLLARAPRENAGARAALTGPVITLPLPDGRFTRVRLEESPILAPALTAAFPEIKTFRGVGVDDPTVTARLDVTLHGFHAQVIAAGGTVYVDPYSPFDRVNHVSYDKASLQRGSDRLADIVDGAGDELERAYNELPMTNGTALRTYRLALAATAEYTSAAGGTKPLALSRMTTTMNRVNGIYERELAVRFTVSTGTAADPTALIFTDTATDGYTNNNGGTMLSENQAKLDSVIGSANYDIGHVFSTGGGGVATLRSVCSAPNKARGVTGLSNPVGDVFAVDYVSHEMGHQFGANHSFNSSSGSCGANRSAAHAYEVGSGSTIMSYSGLCAPENIQNESHDVFAFDSLNEITAYITSSTGATCGVVTATGNALPVVTSPGATFTIPGQTPFALTATATDANSDALTYSWEEQDRNNFTTANPFGTDDGVSPLFRSYAPTTSPTRFFPSLGYILNNANAPPATYTCSAASCLVGELLPSTSRTMTFQVLVRDNRSGGGAISSARTLVSVNPALGPLTVASPSSAWAASSSQTVTWTVNGTNGLAANVSILLSTDGGLTFPIVLSSNTPNDGSQLVSVPSIPATTTARIKVQAVDNIFFDINNANFTVTGPVVPTVLTKATPANGATGLPEIVTVSWNPVAGAIRYEFCIDTSANATCDNGWTNVGLVTSLMLGLPTSTTQTWQVRVVTASGTSEADGGTWWSFTTAGTIITPTSINKTAPANGATGQPQTLTLTWTADPAAIRYEFCIDTSVNATCDNGWTNVGLVTSLVLNGLPQSTTQTWQVRSVTAGGTSQANGGTWWTFTTAGTIIVPSGIVKTAVPNGSTGHSPFVTLSWTADPAAIRYEFCIDTSVNAVCDNGWGNIGLATSVTLNGLPLSTTQTWQVRAVTTTGVAEANGGAWWTFTTGGARFTTTQGPLPRDGVGLEAAPARVAGR